MPDMAGEAVRDLDETAQGLLRRGLMQYRLGHSVIPITGVNLRRRREYGLEAPHRT